MTQVQVAQTLGSSQANISKIERRDDLYLSTLSEYVEALGGRLELRAVFPDEVIMIDVAALGQFATAQHRAKRAESSLAPPNGDAEQQA